MAQLYESQDELYKTMETLYTNIKKDGKERKTVMNYFTRKLEILEKYWAEYQTNHNKLMSLEDDDLPYWREKHWEKAESLYIKINEYINISMESQSKQPCQDQKTPGTSKEFQTPSINVGQQRETVVESRNKRSQGSTSKSDDMLHKQDMYFKAFTRTIRSINLEEISEKWEFEDVLSQLQDRWKMIDSQHWKIQEELDGEDEEYENSFTQHERMYIRLKRDINSKLWSVSHREKSTPKIDIPTFTGNYHQWVSFKDLFSEAIHLNPALSKAQKMQFLKSKG